MGEKKIKKIKIKINQTARKSFTGSRKKTYIKVKKNRSIKIKKHKQIIGKKVSSISKSKMNEIDSGIYKGGEAFARGGFGCLFRPALKCQDQDVPPTYVSKLSLKRDAEREYGYIAAIKKRLEGLPDNIKEFLMLYNVTICTPKPLTDADKVNLDTVCKKNLSKITDRGTGSFITSANINSNIEKFKAINMPQLDMDVNKYIQRTRLTPEDLIRINDIIIQYVMLVIPNLYRRGVVHGDIKSENMMFKLGEGNKPVLIDWGLSYVTDEKSKKAPTAIYELATQWHHPFSSFLFKRKVVESYESFVQTLRANGLEVTRNTILPFVLSAYSNFMNHHSSQFMTIYNIFTTFYKEDFEKYFEKSEVTSSEYLTMYNITLKYITDYIIDILVSYTVNYRLNLDLYFSEVYLMNVDTWGVLSIYYDYFEKSKEMFSLSSRDYKIFTTMVMYLLVDNVFTGGNRKLDITKIIAEINKINSFLKSIKGKPQLPSIGVVTAKLANYALGK